MMASMQPSFPPHPAAGMQQHPGGPGHPMGAPGMVHNPSQPGGPQGIPHQLPPHMAVSGPGGQMNPGPLVGGMPPGAGPNAHAMSHLSPAQAQLFQQHGNMGAFAASNQAVQQLHQQQRLQTLQQQQHARQLMQQAYAQNPGMGGIPVGMNLLSPAGQQQAQQMAAFRARQQHGGNPQAAHAMIAQQIQLQQQQVAANNQMVQPGGNPHQPPMNPHFQQAHIQQAMQMQQLQMQAQAQAQAHQHAQLQAQSQQAQAQAQAQAQGPHQQPNQQPQPGQQPQPNAQQQSHGPNAQGGNLPGQGQGQNQGPGPQGNQPQQPNQQGQQQQQQQNQQQPQQGPSQAQQQVHQAQLQQAQQNAMAHSISQQMAQRQLRDLKGQCTLKLLSFAEYLSSFPGSKNSHDTQYWDNFVRMFFAENGVFRYTMPETDEEQQPKTFDITYPSLPRYFHTQYESGVKSIQLVLDKTTDQAVPNSGRHVIETGKATMLYWFEGGSHVVATGTLRAMFDPQHKIESLEFITSHQEEYISRKLVIEAAKPAHNWVKEWHKVNTPDSKQSPEMSKKGKAKLMKSPQNPPPDLDLPHSALKHNSGVTAAVHQFLEMVEVLGQMGPLIQFYHTHPGTGPYTALEQYVNQINTQPPQNMAMAMNMNMANGQPGGPMQPGGQPRTPSFGQFQMGQSPAQAHQMLPGSGSPHIGGSPAPGQMQAPMMQLQVSQQGTNSSGNPSANTSPSQNNKRRRPSGVKNEDDGGPQSAPTPASAAAGTPQLNGVQGAKGKPPTPRITKRVKANPA